MTPQEILSLSPALSAYLRNFDDCFARQRTRDHLQTYCRGLLSDLPRKSVEPIALEAGTAVRTLQEFLKDHRWDQQRMRDLLQQRLAQADPPDSQDDLGTIGLIDETSQAKKGDKTPGVQRQWCGSLGKVENCVVTVHLGVARGTFKTLIDADLFLPQAWSEDRERCREADIPEDVVYRPKWKIALEQVDRACAHGVVFDWMTFDEGYGSKPGFLQGLEQRGLLFVGEVPRSFRCLTTIPQGKRPTEGYKGKRVENLARFSSAFHQQDWQGVQLARMTLEDQTWQVRAGQVYLLVDGNPTPRTYWLIVARNEATGEVKYFLSNAPVEIAVEQLLRVGFRRWNVEHLFRVSKTELGWGHFEGRSYTALHRHLMICLLMMSFVAEQTERLREKKSGDHVGASLSSVESALRRLDGEPPSDNSTGPYQRRDSLSPTTKSGSQTLATAA